MTCDQAAQEHTSVSAACMHVNARHRRNAATRSTQAACVHYLCRKLSAPPGDTPAPDAGTSLPAPGCSTAGTAGSGLLPLLMRLLLLLPAAALPPPLLPLLLLLPLLACSLAAAAAGGRPTEGLLDHPVGRARRSAAAAAAAAAGGVALGPPLANAAAAAVTPPCCPGDSSGAVHVMRLAQGSVGVPASAASRPSSVTLFRLPWPVLATPTEE